jgi:hypothetical protein
MSRISFRYVFPTILGTAIGITVIFVLYGLVRANFSSTEPDHDAAEADVTDVSHHKDKLVFHGATTPEVRKRESFLVASDEEYRRLEADMHKPKAEGLRQRQQLVTQNSFQPLEPTLVMETDSDIYEDISISKIGPSIFLKAHPFTQYSIEGLFNDERMIGYLLQPASLKSVRSASFASEAALKDFMGHRGDNGVDFETEVKLDASTHAHVLVRSNSITNPKKLPELAKAFLALDYAEIEGCIADPRQFALLVYVDKENRSLVELNERALQIATEQRASIAKFLQPEKAVIAASGRTKVSASDVVVEEWDPVFTNRSLRVGSYLVKNVFCRLGRHAHFVYWSASTILPSYSPDSVRFDAKKLFATRVDFENGLAGRNAAKSLMKTDVSFHGKVLQVTVYGLPLNYAAFPVFARQIVEEVACGQFTSFARTAASELGLSNLACLIIPK